MKQEVSSGCRPISSANSLSDSSGRDLRTCATKEASMMRSLCEVKNVPFWNPFRHSLERVLFFSLAVVFLFVSVALVVVPPMGVPVDVKYGGDVTVEESSEFELAVVFLSSGDRSV